jgi:hypothetical protein
MASVTKTIGAAGDYSTVAAWASDLNNGAVYTSGDTAIGQIIDLEAICNVSMPSTVLVAEAHLTSHPTVRHTGAIGTGARLLPRASSYAISAFTLSYKVRVSYLEIDYELAYHTTNTAAITFGNSAQGGSIEIHSCLCYGFINASGSNAYGIQVSGFGNGPCKVENTAVFHLRRASSFGTTIGIKADAHSTTVANCLVFDTQDVGTGPAWGFAFASNTTAYNNISLGNKTADYTGSVGAGSNNASSDATALGTSPITGVGSDANFVSLIGGNPELISGSSLIGAGVAVSGLTTDAAGEDYASPPSVGPREYVAPSGSTLHPLYATGRK